MDYPFKKTANGLELQVRVKPRSSKKGIDGLDGNTLIVRLTAPPADGQANKQLIDVLSKDLGVGKSSISIIRGESSRKKTILVKS